MVRYLVSPHVPRVETVKGSECGSNIDDTLTCVGFVQIGEISLDPPALASELENPQEVGVYINDIMRYFARNEVLVD